MTHRFTCLLIALGLAVFSANFALSQATATATIVGTVTDSTGAVV